MTCLWQVNGRSDRTFEERLKYDIEYIRRHGVRLDLAILRATLFAVVSGRGAY